MSKSKEFWVEKLGEGWTMKLRDTLKSEQTENLLNFLQIEYSLHKIYPPREDIFKCFKLCPIEDIKVVIIGDFPKYNGANGLAYGTLHTEFYNYDLFNIHKTIEKEFYNGFCLDFDYTLESWAKQGVLLLNLSLTARDYNPISHVENWKSFVKDVLKIVTIEYPSMIYLLWGKIPQKVIPYLNKSSNILLADYPAKSYSFKENWKCDNFKKANELLIKKINW